MAAESERKRMNVTSTTSCVRGLNSLPDNVHGLIISRLPMKDAILTSLISKDWRYKWRSAPIIIFDKSFLSHVKKKDLKYHESKLINFIYNVLILHEGSINKFVFSAPLRDCSSMDTWIHVLQKKGIETCILKFPRLCDYTVHSKLFCCKRLTTLALWNCTVKLPSGFRGFCSLKSLELDRISFSNSSDLEILISNCQLLQELQLAFCTGFYRLKIHAPELQALTLRESCIELCIDFAPRVSELYIYLSCGTEVSHDIDDELCQSISAFLERLPLLRSLQICGGFLEHLSFCHCPMSYIPQPHIKFLVLDLNFNSSKGFEAFLWMLLSCPNLHELYIKSCSAPEVTSSIVDFRFLDSVKLNLQILTLDEIVGIEPELKFIEHLLEKAPFLEEARLTIRGNIKENPRKGQKLLKQLLSFRRASRSARIFVED